MHTEQETRIQIQLYCFLSRHDFSIIHVDFLSVHVVFFLYVRIWDDNSRHYWRKGLPDVLRPPWLCRHHPFLQSLPGACHHRYRLRPQVLSRTTPQQGCAPSKWTSCLWRRWSRWISGRWSEKRGGSCWLEALSLLCHAYPRSSSWFSVLLRLADVLSSRGLGLPGLALLLLCGLQHHWVWGYGEQPESCVRGQRYDCVPAGQLPLHPDWRLLHLLPFQRHLHCHQAGPQLVAEEAGSPLPLLLSQEGSSAPPTECGRPRPPP